MRIFGFVLVLGVLSFPLYQLAADTASDGASQEMKSQLANAQNALHASMERASFAAHPATDDDQQAARQAFQVVYETLTHPRCMNCHPVGDRPLQTDESLPHAMNISRASVQQGLSCNTCHREDNSEALGIVGGPPGAPHWDLPDEDMPLVFQDRSPTELCEQLKRPGDNGFKTLDALLGHVQHDALVLWGWHPGGNRSVPNATHEEFVRAFEIWVRGHGACP